MKKDLCVNFKSLPIYFEKEKNGIKPNTVRVVDWEDKRFQNYVPAAAVIRRVQVLS